MCHPCFPTGKVSKVAFFIFQFQLFSPCIVLIYHSSTIFLVLGDIMQLINQLGIANNTLIIFTSDNGAALVSRQKGMPMKYHVLHKKVFHKIYRLPIRVIKVT